MLSQTCKMYWFYAVLCDVIWKPGWFSETFGKHFLQFSNLWDVQQHIWNSCRSVWHFYCKKLFCVVSVVSNKWPHERLPSHLWPQTAKRHGFCFVFLPQSINLLKCFFVFACLRWSCVALFTVTQQVWGPSASLPSWTWWTRGRTRRTSWRTSCFHWGGVSTRALRLTVPPLWPRVSCTHARLLKFANRWKKNWGRDGRIKEKEGVRGWKKLCVLVCVLCVCHCLGKSLYVSCKLLFIRFADAAIFFSICIWFELRHETQNFFHVLCFFSLPSPSFSPSASPSSLIFFLSCAHARTFTRLLARSCIIYRPWNDLHPSDAWENLTRGETRSEWPELSSFFFFCFSLSVVKP